MATHATTYTGILSSAASSISIGYAIVPNTDGQFVVATTANRASYGRSRGVAITAASGVNAAFEFRVAGILSAADSGVGTGTAGDWVRVKADGSLERTATVSAGNDVIGRCPHTTGDVQIMPGVWDNNNTGASAFTAPTGTGFMTTTSGAMDAASLAFPLTVPKGGTGASSLPAGLIQGNGTGALTSITTSAAVAALISDKTGTGAMVFANTPSLVTPVIGAATGTSAALSSFVSIGASPASSGALRLSDENIVRVGASNRRAFYFTGTLLNIGGDSGFADTVIDATTSHTLAVGGTTKVWITSAGLRLADSAGGQYLTIAVPDLAADRTLNVPTLTGPETIAVLDLAQTLTNKTVSGPSFTASSFLAVGAGTLASAGDMRTPTGARTLIAGRNSADTADITYVGKDVADVLYLGTDSLFTASKQAVGINAYTTTGGSIALGIGATTYLYLTGGDIECWAPIAGSNTASLPFRFKRASVTITGNTTLTAAQYECPFIDLDGSPAGAFDVVCPDTAGATFNFKNNSGQTATIKKSGGTGFTIANGATAWAHHDGTDYESRTT